MIISQDTTATTTFIQNTPALDKTEEYLNRKMDSDKSDTDETEAKPSMGEKVFTQKSKRCLICLRGFLGEGVMC